jgi:hypothetical protein
MNAIEAALNNTSALDMRSIVQQLQQEAHSSGDFFPEAEWIRDRPDTKWSPARYRLSSKTPVQRYSGGNAAVGEFHEAH